MVGIKPVLVQIIPVGIIEQVSEREVSLKVVKGQQSGFNSKREFEVFTRLFRRPALIVI